MCHLLIVGFCLVCFGIVSLALGMGSQGITLQACIETLSSKLGWVVLIIGAMHFLMLSVFAAMGQTLLPTSSSQPRGTGSHSVSSLVSRRNPADGELEPL